MFDWFWEFLYLLTKSIFRLIDGLISCTNYLCGIEPIKIDGVETDMLTWLIQTEEIKTGIISASLISIFLIVFFSIWGIIRTVVSEKPDMTPSQVCMKAFKSLLTFLFVPFVMVCVIAAFNTIGKALYVGTNGGANQGLGTFLVGAFSQDALLPGVDKNYYTSPGFDYTDTGMCWNYFDLSDFDYFYSWVAGIAILFTMAKVLFVFVERLFSIVVLYVISPIPIATSIIDEGQHFKSWRDQIISKFCVGYGAIVGLNIYAIVISKLSTSDIEFFNNGFIDFLFKIVIILGGSFALNRIVTMIGNLFGKGGADQDFASAGGLQKGVTSTGALAAKGVTQGLSFVGNLAGKGVSKLFGKGGNNKPGGSGEGGDSDKGQESSSTGLDGSTGNKNPNAGKVSQNAGMTPQGQAISMAKDIIEGKKQDDDDDGNKKEENKPNSAVGNVLNSTNTAASSESKEGGNKK